MLLAVSLFGLAMLLLTILRIILGLLPAIVAALVIWFLTGSLLYAAIVFVVVAFLWAIARRR
jgi:hypothetical protein